MASYAGIVVNEIEEIPFNQLIVASELYKKVSGEITEQSFYKALERFSKSGKLVHLTKGIYYRPKKHVLEKCQFLKMRLLNII